MPVVEARSPQLPPDSSPASTLPLAVQGALTHLLLRRGLQAVLAGGLLVLLLAVPAAQREASDEIDNALAAARLSRYLGNLSQLSDTQALAVLRHHDELHPLRLRVTDGWGEVRIGAELPVSATERSVAWTVLRPDGTPWTVALVATPESHWSGALQASLRSLLWFLFGAAVVLAALGWALLRQAAATRPAADSLQRADAASRAATRQLLAAQAAENSQLARQLMDRLGQQLSLLRVDTIWLRRHLQGDERTAPVLANLLHQLTALSRAWGRLLQPLALPEALQGSADNTTPWPPHRLGDALQALADSLAAPEGQARRCQLRYSDDGLPLPAPLIQAVYRLSEQALRHLTALAPAADLQLRVQVDGAQGLVHWEAQAHAAGPLADRASPALTLARAQAQAYGGLLQADRGPGGSLRLHARLLATEPGPP